MDQFIMANLIKMVKDQALENVDLLMEVSILVNGVKTNQTEQDDLFLPKEIYMKETGLLDKHMDMEN